MNTRTLARQAWAGAVVLLTAAAAFGQENLWPANLSLGPAVSRNLGANPRHPQHLAIRQEASLMLGDLTYEIRYCACVDPAHQGKVAPLEGYIGMPQPCSCNWYHSGFLFISVNGRDIGTTPLSSMIAAQRGDRAILDMVWHGEAADVRARFLGLPNHDAVYCEIALEPRQPIKSVGLRLNCYPSCFTHARQRDGARRIRTPATLVQQGQNVAVPADKNWWAFYYDEIFDVAKGEGEGPCGLMLLPEEATEISFRPGSYGVGNEIKYPAATGRMRLALWDFKGKTNAESLARMRSGAQTARQELASLDFTPTAVKKFDLATLRAEVERSVQSPTVRTSLGKKAAAIQAWLDRYAPSQSKTAVSDIAAQERLLQSLEKYEEFSWEIKLAELLSKL